MAAELYENMGDSISETLPLKGNGYEEAVQETDRFSGCGCFPGSCFGTWRVQAGSRAGVLHPEDEAKECVWLRDNAKKVKQLSEVLAGPRWKNFIRGNSNSSINRKKTASFQYDPRSYALNFDDGIDKEEHGVFLNFPSRFPVQLKAGDA